MKWRLPKNGPSRKVKQKNQRGVTSWVSVPFAAFCLCCTSYTFVLEASKETFFCMASVKTHSIARTSGNAHVNLQMYSVIVQAQIRKYFTYLGSYFLQYSYAGFPS